MIRVATMCPHAFSYFTRVLHHTVDHTDHFAHLDLHSLVYVAAALFAARHSH